MNFWGKVLVLLLVCLIFGSSLFVYRASSTANQQIKEAVQRVNELQREVKEQELQLEKTYRLLEQVTEMRHENEELYLMMREWLEAWQVESFESTAYTLNCGNGDGYTSTMTRPEAGRTIAVDPEVVPLGSSVYVDGLGWRLAEDTGGLIKGRVIDLYVGEGSQALEQAYRWGRREVLVAYKK